MSKKFSLLIIYVCGIFITFAQSTYYSPQNLHAHNDYEKPMPFWTAFDAGAGSIEADIFLVDGKLLLAHSPDQIKKEKSLEAIYLKPVDSMLAKKNGKLSNQAGYHLQLMIDIKSAAVPALDTLIRLLQRYPKLMAAQSVTITISGNRPLSEDYNKYPAFIAFDGLPDKEYTSDQLNRIPMFSDNFKHYSSWNGDGPIPPGDREKLNNAISKVHALGKTIRFWNAPDKPNAWKELVRLKADWINTDKVVEAASWLDSQR